MAVTRIKNNQITDATIFANVKIAPRTITGELFNQDVTINSNINIVGNLQVTGNTSTINSTNTLVNDPLVIFNNGYVGSPAYDVGILINRNLQPTSPTNYGGLNTAWVWREADNSFQALLTTETGLTQGSINRTAYANVTIGNTIVQTSSSVDSVDTTTGAFQVKGGASFTQNVQIGGNGSVFGTQSGAVAFDGNVPIVQITEGSSSRYGLMIVDTNSGTGALSFRAGPQGSNIGTIGGTGVGNDIYIQPNRIKSIWLPAANGAVLIDNGINSSFTNNIAALNVTGSGGIYAGGNINVGTSASFEGAHVFIQSAKLNDVVIGKNQLKTGLSANVVALGAMQGTTSIGTNSTLVGAAAGPAATPANATYVGKSAGNLATGSDSTYIGYNAGSLVTTGQFNLIVGNYDGNAIATLSNQVVVADGAGAPRIRIDAGGNVFVVSGLNSTTANNGAFVVQGGAGIGGNLNIGGAMSIASGRLDMDATLTSIVFGGNTATTYLSTDSVLIGQKIGSGTNFGSKTTIVGSEAANTNTNAAEVTLYGYRAGYSGPGQRTTAVGVQSGLNTTTGVQNQFFGYNAGAQVVSGSYNVIIGGNTGSTISSLSNRIILADGQGTARINITDTGSTEITSTVESDSIGTGALIVDGGLSVEKNARIGGNLTVTGNLNVIGTVSTVNSTFVTVVDPIIEMGGLANAAALTSNDGKDRGLRMHYYDGVDRSVFLGWQNSTGNLIYLQSATESAGNVFSGTYGSVQFGQLKLSNANPSTSQTSGALQVVGGIGTQGRLTANNAVIDNNLTASGSGAIITFSPSGSGYVTINPATKGSIDNMAIGQSTPVEATVTNLVVNTNVTMNGSGNIRMQPSGPIQIGPSTYGNIDNMFIGNVTPRQAAFTAANIGQDLVMKAFSSNSILFISPSGNLTVDQRNLQFNFQRQTGNTFSTVGLHVGTDGDFGGTDTLNIYYQGDSYLPQNAISANVLGQLPGWSVSTSRGSTHSPTNSVDGDVVGTFGAYAYTGTGAYDEISGIRTVVSGTTNALNGIGGELQIWTKRDNSDHTLALRVDNNQKGTFYGQVAIANSTVSTTTSSGALYVQGGTAIGGNLNVSQGARFNDQQNHNRDFLVRGGNDATLIWGSTASSYNQVLIGNSAVVGNLVTGAKLQVLSSDSILLPSGTEAQRPGVLGYGTAVAGMLRFNTTAGDLEYYDGTKWFQAQAGATATIIADTFNGDGINTQFTMQRPGTTAGTFVAINGTLQQPVSAYTISGNVITFTEAPSPGDVISSRTVTASVIRGLTSTYGSVTVSVDDPGVLITGSNGNQASNAFVLSYDGTVGYRGTLETAVGTSPVAIHSFPANRYRSAKYVVQVRNSTLNAYEASEVLVIHNDTYAYRTQYNMISTLANAAALGNITVAISSGNVNLYYQGNSIGNQVKVKADLLGSSDNWSPY